jgi:hypothetical protein
MKLSLFFLSAAAMVNAATATEPVVDIGTAGNYVILSKTGISTVPTSDITGNIGVSPIAATAITGFSLIMHSGGQYSSSSQITGQAIAADYGGDAATALTTAVGDMELAYNDAESRASTTDIVPTEGAISGSFSTGVYTFEVDISFNEDITFSGTATDVFIMQTTGSLSQAADTKVLLSDGALAKNVFWQVAGQVTVGEGSHMEGIILVKTDALFMTGSSLSGHVLAQTACNIQMTTIVAAPSS